MKEILKVNNLIKKFPKAGGEIDDADAISVLKGINFDVEQGEYVGIMGMWKDNTSEDPGIYGSADGRRCDL
jgi:ABC-type polysaccharide/polyol phosphate transport system ATPase subunit